MRKRSIPQLRITINPYSWMFRVRRGYMPRLRLDFIICGLFDVTIFPNIRICGHIYTYLIVCVINIHNMCMLIIT